MTRVNNNIRVSTQSSGSQQRVDISTLSSNSSTRRSGSNNRVTTGNRNTATNASRQTPQGTISSRTGQGSGASPTSNRTAANDANRNSATVSGANSRSTSTASNASSGTQSAQTGSLGGMWKAATNLAQSVFNRSSSSPTGTTNATSPAKFNESAATKDMPAHKEIAGISNFRENAGEWADRGYRFGGKEKHYMNAADKAAGKEATLGQLGCTITAYSNAASIVRQKNPNAVVPNPGDANQRNSKFENAINSVDWKPLTTEKHPKFDGTSKAGRTDIYSADGTRNNSSKAGTELMERIYDSAKSGKPVVVGMHGNSKGGVRHTVLVTGIVPGGKRGDPSALVVRDQWRGKNGSQGPGVNEKTATAAEKTTLDKTMTKNYGAVYTQIDMAMSASPK
jgi:hypothetical protein